MAHPQCRCHLGQKGKVLSNGNVKVTILPPHFLPAKLITFDRFDAFVIGSKVGWGGLEHSCRILSGGVDHWKIKEGTWELKESKSQQTPPMGSRSWEPLSSSTRNFGFRTSVSFQLDFVTWRCQRKYWFHSYCWRNQKSEVAAARLSTFCCFHRNTYDRQHFPKE